MSPSDHPVVRILTLLAGVIVLGAALWGCLFVLLTGAIAAQLPDPDEPSGEPCCPYPDSWTEVSGWALGALVLAAIVGVLFAVAAALIVRGARVRSIPTRRLAAVPVATTLFTAAAMAAGLIAAAL